MDLEIVRSSCIFHLNKVCYLCCTVVHMDWSMLHRRIHAMQVPQYSAQDMSCEGDGCEGNLPD
jgi:hypothetical protein